MPRITAIKRDRKGRMAVSLDGQPAFTLASEVVASHGLHEGDDLIPEQVAELERTDDLVRARQVALRYLAYRPRSEKEIRDRLRRGGFAPGTIGSCLRGLKGAGLVDDAAFAKSWKEGREASRPRGRRLLVQELRRKGVDAGVVREVVRDVDEEAGAWRVAEKKASALAGLDEATFRRRLGSFLLRRGYGHELVARVVERTWMGQNSEEMEEV